MILNTTGGTPLNFRVIGNPKPETSKENTIWVNTDLKIPGYVFSPTDVYMGRKDIDLLEGMNLGNGALNSSGGVEGQNSGNPEVYTESYIPVKSGKSYTYNYTASESKSLWLAIVEYKEGNVFSKRLVPVDKVTATEKTGTYTPSSESVVAVRLSWRTWPNVETKVRFVEPDAEYQISEPEEGTVWVKTGMSSKAAFNALRKNALQVCPLEAKQYVEGQWVRKEAEIWQNGGWVQFITLFDGFLFNYGSVNEELTGGWVKDGKGTVTTQSNGSVAIAPTTGNDQAIYRTANKIDLSAFSTLTMNGIMWEQNGWYRTHVCVWSDVTYGNYEKGLIASTKGNSNAEKDYTVDVSALTGSYYIGIVAMDHPNYAKLTMNTMKLT